MSWQEKMAFDESHNPFEHLLLRSVEKTFEKTRSTVEESRSNAEKL
jgi:hypothetical protein